MPAFTLTPSSEGTHTAWTLGAGGSKTAAVDKDSGDATYIYSPSGGGGNRNSFVQDDIDSSAVQITGNVSARYRIWDGNTQSATYRQYWRYSGTNDDSAAVDNPSTSPADFTNNFATFNSGTPWTVAIINGLEIGIHAVTSGSYQQRCGELYTFGNYVQGGGGMAYLVVSLIGGLLGANLALADMPGIAREAFCQKKPGIGRSLIRPDEYMKALQELKDPAAFRRYIDYGARV